MKNVIRHNTFKEISKLDTELDSILNQLDFYIGKKVNQLPQVGSVPELSKFFVKQSDNTYKIYQKLDNEFVEL